MSEFKPNCPKVYCLKEKRYVEIWWCLGSYIQGREVCPELIEATVKTVENLAAVKCRAIETEQQDAEFEAQKGLNDAEAEAKDRAEEDRRRPDGRK